MTEAQPIRLKSPLAEDELVFHSLEAHDELSHPYQFDIGLLSPNEDLAFNDLLGKEATVEVDLADEEVRYFHGVISEFEQTGRQGDNASYSMRIRPRFWFLTRTYDCQIFQNMSVTAIIEQVLQDYGVTDFELRLVRNYPPFDYCVQYRESTFSFLSRLMEQEGIYYYFLHESDRHVLILADDYSSHEPLPHYGSIPYYPPSRTVDQEYAISDWSIRRSLRSGTYVLGAFDFTKPKALLEVNSSVSREHALNDYEVYDYPGEYVETSQGNVYARNRIEEEQARFERMHGVTNVRGMFSGGLFNLEEYPREDQNQQYLVVACHQSISGMDYRSATGGLEFQCAFEAIESRTPFRPLRSTAKPTVQGPQTAIVTGESGEEIHTDEYGRVKVQFHWDRYGSSDANSSCWVRVSQGWAGTNWGSIYIPRIGQEVVVEFLEGDPDRPLITGRVYNADNMPPYELPANKTQSGVKSRSTKSGTGENFNEIRFEDKKGEEEMFLHAEKDQTTEVKNNQLITVGTKPTDGEGDRALDVARDKTERVGRNKAISVEGGHSETIAKSMTITVGSMLTENVATNYAETVGGAMELTVGAALAISVGAAMTETVGANKVSNVGNDSAETIGDNKTLEVGSTLSETVGEDQVTKVAKSLTESIGDNQETTVGKDFVLNAKTIQLVAKDEIKLKVGSAELLMKKNGDILLKGKKINVKGSGDVILKGSKIKGN